MKSVSRVVVCSFRSEKRTVNWKGKQSIDSLSYELRCNVRKFTNDQLVTSRADQTVDIAPRPETGEGPRAERVAS